MGINWTSRLWGNSVRGLAFLITLALIVVIFMVLSQPLSAGAKCDAFDQGFEDGYCYDAIYQCYAPWPPMCLDSHHRSVEQAYHRGFEEGLRRRR